MCSRSRVGESQLLTDSMRKMFESLRILWVDGFTNNRLLPDSYNWYSQLSRLAHGESRTDKRESLLAVFLGKVLNSIRPFFLWKTSGRAEPFMRGVGPV